MKEYTTLGKVLEYKITESGVSFRFEQGTAEIQLIEGDVFRFRMTQHASFGPERHWVVEERGLKTAPFENSIDGCQLSLKTEVMGLMIDLEDFTMRVSDHSDSELARQQSVGWRGHSVRSWWALPSNAHFYGCGEKVGFIDRRGRQLEMWTTDSIPHLPDTDPMYQSIPFFLGLNGGKAFGVFLNNSYRSFFDFGKTDPDCYGFWAEDGEMDYYFFTGPAVGDVVESYTKITGRMPLPPLWSLGFQQSRYSYYPEMRLREVAGEFRRRDIPCDAIYLDIHYMDEYRVFTWDHHRFPQPKKLLHDLREEGFKPISIIDPGVKIDPEYPVFQEGVDGDYFCRLKSGEYLKGQVWPGEVYFPDFLKESTRRWWGRLDARLIEDGMAGIWNDMNEPSNFLGPIDKDVVHGDDGEIAHAEGHNLYGLMMCKATFDGLLESRPNERPFILTRSGFAGIQRYAAVWLGDNHSWWEHLAAAVPMLINMGLSGLPFVGVDVGGFCDDCEGELFARWIAMGCFTPFFRVHTAIDTVDQEPWSFGTEVESIARRYIKLRYELLPYIYDCFYEASQSGKPVMRPLLMDFQGDPRTYRIDDAYLFGPALLVAPVYRPGLDYRAVYLPEGDWYDFWSGEIYHGGQVLSVETPLARIPVYVRAGSIIPRQPALHYVGERVPEYLCYEIFPKGESRYLHYEDDGRSRNYLNGVYAMTFISCTETPEGIQVRIAEPKGSYRMPSRRLLIKLHCQDIKDVKVNGRSIQYVEGLGQNGPITGWCSDGTIVTVGIPNLDGEKEIIFTVHQA